MPAALSGWFFHAEAFRAVCNIPTSVRQPGRRGLREGNVNDHEKDIAEFEKAEGEVKNEDLKKFITDTVPVMKEHLEMARKMEGKR